MAAPAITSTFNYSVVGQRAGKFTMPAFEVAVAGKRVRVPPAMLTLVEPEAGDAPYQPVRVELDLPQRDFFVGESIGARLLVFESPDESPQFFSHVAKTTGAAVFRPSMRPSREQFTFRGKQYEGLVMPVRITPILEGELELGCQVVVRVQKLRAAGAAGVGRERRRARLIEARAGPRARASAHRTAAGIYRRDWEIHHRAAEALGHGGRGRRARDADSRNGGRGESRGRRRAGDGERRWLADLQADERIPA